MIIWTLIVVLALAYPVGLASSKAWRASSEPWPGTHTVAAGMIICFLYPCLYLINATPTFVVVFLSHGFSWYTLHFIDLVLHRLEIWVTYSYAVVGTPFLSIFRVCSDVLVFLGVLRLAARFAQPCYRPIAISPSFPELEWNIGFFFWALTLTRSFILFALSFCWLSATVNVAAIDKLAMVCYALDAAYAAAQFVGVLWMAVDSWDKKLTQRLSYSTATQHDRSNNRRCWDVLNLAVLTSLLGRSFCEVVIAGEMSRATEVDFRLVTRVRDITHGVFTVPLFWGLCFALPTERALMDKWVDKAKADLRAKLAGLISEKTQKSGVTGPDVKDLLDEMEKNPLFKKTPPTQSTPVDHRRESKRRAKEATERYYLGELRKQYTTWTPIQRWNAEGANGLDIFASQTHNLRTGQRIGKSTLETRQEGHL